MKTNSEHTTSHRPAWRIALFISLPLCVCLIADSISYARNMTIFTSGYLHMPGFLLWVALRAALGGEQYPDIAMVCVFNCLFYFGLIWAGVAAWREVRAPRQHRAKSRKKRHLVLWSLILVICITALCVYPYRMNVVPIEVRELAEPNPTSYVFAKSIESIIIQTRHGLGSKPQLSQEFFGNLGFVTTPWRGKVETVGLSVETSDEVFLGKNVFSDPANENDMYLTLRKLSIASRTYFALGESLPYVADFHVHLEPVGSDSTRVTVSAIEPGVFKGSDGLSRGGYSPKRIPVEPTTIEEYTILLFIGHMLGEESMPKLRLPVS